MKNIVLLVLTALLLTSTHAQHPVNILHYEFNIELNDYNDTIIGKSKIQLVALRQGRSIQLDFSGSSTNKKSLQVLKTVLESQSAKSTTTTASSFTHNNDKLIVEAKQTFNANDTMLLTVYYKGVPKDGLIISKNMYGKRTFFADNWPNRAHNWIPCIDEPADKATLEFRVTAPSHYQVISNGIQIEETNLSRDKKFTHWREDIPLPTKVMVIGVADFAVQHAGFVNNCIPVSTWVFPENMEKGFFDYSIGKSILAFLDQYIGPFPYRKLANVQSKTIYGGMENAGAIFYYESSVNGQQAEESLFAHEIAHQWFGDMATEKSFAHLWLSEGFATYLTHIYMESRYGTDSLNNRMKEDRSSVLSFVKDSKRPVVDSTSNYKSLLNANSYQKGSWILHMLRRKIGDSLFHETIRKYYTLYGGSNAETRDLQHVAEKVSNRILETFFNQWLYQGVNPELQISWKQDLKSDELIITIEQLQKGIVFELPLELELIFDDGKKEVRQFDLNKQTHSFLLTGKSSLIKIHPDPNTSILAEFNINKGK